MDHMDVAAPSLNHLSGQVAMFRYASFFAGVKSDGWFRIVYNLQICISYVNWWAGDSSLDCVIL